MCIGIDTDKLKFRSSSDVKSGTEKRRLTFGLYIVMPHTHINLTAMKKVLQLRVQLSTTLS